MIPKLIYIILKFDFLAARDWEVGKLSSLKVEKALRLRGVDCEDTIKDRQCVCPHTHARRPVRKAMRYHMREWITWGRL